MEVFRNRNRSKPINYEINVRVREFPNIANRDGTIVIWETVAGPNWDVNMVGELRHFEIPYVKAYMAKRFHRTAFGWKANDMPQNDSISVEAPTATISVSDIDEALEHVKH